MTITSITGQERYRSTMALAARRNNQATAGHAAPAAQQADSITISPEARAAAEVAATPGDPISRDERISALKAAIASGTYSVDSKTLATTLVKNFAQ